mgnify:FL=1
MNSDESREILMKIKNEISKNIIWQKELIRDLLIGLFSWGHLLLEWAPGLAKTFSVSTLSKVLDLDFKRIQFTPDLLPSDLIGSKIYDVSKKDFSIKKWPIFSNIILADEINRAPSKVQSALLEAMAEKQVTIWDKTFVLESPFMVLATQNPLEQSGTFQLPEAQLDRFLLKTLVQYPSKEEEKEILKQFTQEINIIIEKIIDADKILEIQKEIENITVSESIYDYVTDIVAMSRSQEFIEKDLILWASPRAAIAFIKTAKTLAFLEWRDFVLPEDIKTMAFPILRHRLILSYEAIADGKTTDQIISNILDLVTIK